MKFVYKSTPKGPPSMSGRSTAKIHRNLAQYQRGAYVRLGQRKQK